MVVIHVLICSGCVVLMYVTYQYTELFDVNSVSECSMHAEYV